MIASMPGFMVGMHDFIHHWELPIIAFSGLVLLLGWGITWYSDKMDCHDTGCCHGSCAPKKGKAHLVLIGATVLFTFNLGIYLFVHQSNIIQQKLETHHHDGQEDHSR